MNLHHARPLALRRRKETDVDKEATTRCGRWWVCPTRIRTKWRSWGFFFFPCWPTSAVCSCLCFPVICMPGSPGACLCLFFFFLMLHLLDAAWLVHCFHCPCGDFIYRHHEEPQSKLHDPEEGTFPIPKRYVDVMRQRATDTSIVSGNIISDSWTEASGVDFSEVSTGTRRFQILHARPPEGFKCVLERPADPKYDHTTRYLSWSLETVYPRNKQRKLIAEWNDESANLQTTRRNRRTYEVSVDDKDYLMVKAEARLKTEQKNAVAMPCLLKEDSCGNLLACATLMEASCGIQEADNEMVYDRKHMGHISENKKICRKFLPWPGTQAHRNLRGINKNSRCQGWSKKEWAKFCARRRDQQTVNFHMPKSRFRRLIWTVLGFFAFWQRNHQTRSKTKSPSEKRPCTFLETKDTLFRHILITVSFIPTVFLVSFALQPPTWPSARHARDQKQQRRS